MKSLQVSAVDRGLLTSLVQSATFAPSLLNTQPWKFRISEKESLITVLPDPDRRLDWLDPDKRYLFISLGCAVENLIIAADHAGFQSSVQYRHYPDEKLTTASVQIKTGTGKQPVQKPPVQNNAAQNQTFQTQPAQNQPVQNQPVQNHAAQNPTSDLYDFIPLRRTNRKMYNKKPVPSEIIDRLNSIGKEPGQNITIYSGTTRASEIGRLVMKADFMLLGSHEQKIETLKWTRFNRKEEEKHGDGISYRNTGGMNVPKWIGRSWMYLFNNGDSEARHDAKKLKSSSALVLFSSEQDNETSWFQTGRVLQRFLLHATAEGLQHAYINSPCEVRQVREELKRYLHLSTYRPQILLRIGYAKEAAPSVRRPVQDVIVT
ncbi:MAG: nitroreductase family protein [Cyclonatronaceae bacterium]